MYVMLTAHINEHVYSTAESSIESECREKKNGNPLEIKSHGSYKIYYLVISK